MMNKSVMTLAIAGTGLVFWGCETRDCLKWQTMYGYQQVCTSYSDTGHCRAYRSEPYKYDVCMEYAEPKPE